MNRIQIISARIAAVAGLVTLAHPWCAGQAGGTEAPAAPSNLTVTLVASDTRTQADNPYLLAALPGINAASAQWTDIKDNTFQQREQFLIGLKRLQARVDLQIEELSAKRALIVLQEAETQSWDFAMKEMENARSFLLSMGAEAEVATPDNWDQTKLKVGSAWLRTQNAYGKVRGSTTI